MAGRADLVDADQQGVAVAVGGDRADVLDVPGGVALAPVLPTRPAPEPGPPGGEGAAHRLGVHPGDHQHGAVGVVLDHRGQEPGGVECEARDGLVDGVGGLRS
jgi:hypothetical protein